MRCLTRDRPDQCRVQHLEVTPLKRVDLTFGILGRRRPPVGTLLDVIPYNLAGFPPLGRIEVLLQSLDKMLASLDKLFRED